MARLDLIDMYSRSIDERHAKKAKAESDEITRRKLERFPPAPPKKKLVRRTLPTFASGGLVSGMADSVAPAPSYAPTQTPMAAQYWQAFQEATRARQQRDLEAILQFA